MKISVEYHLDAIAILKIEGALKHASALMELRQRCRSLLDEGICAVLIDLSKCQRVTMAGLAALVEFSGTSTDFHVAYCEMNEWLKRVLEAAGLDRGLHIHESVSDALMSREFKRVCLRRTTAVVLCNRWENESHQVFDAVPIPMLDVLGQPLLQRIKSQISSYGVRDIIANPGHLGNQILDYFCDPKLDSSPLRFANEGARIDGDWVAEQLGSAGTLQRIQNRQYAFQNDFLVVRGNTMSDVDLVALMTSHQEQRADVTVAYHPAVTQRAPKRPWEYAAASQMAENPIELDPKEFVSLPLMSGFAYVFSPRVLEMAAIQSHWNIQSDFLPALAAAGAKICGFQSDGPIVEISSLYDYARGLSTLLLSPSRRDALLGAGEAAALVSEYAKISNKAIVSGQSYVGRGAKIGAGVEILGTCVIGSGAEISGPSVLENCVVLGGTRVEPGFWAHETTLHRDWSFDHRSEGNACLPMPSELPTFADPIAFPMQKSA